MKDNEEMMQQMLNMLPNDIDKREGSLIYLALVPIAAMLVEQQFYLDNSLAASMPDTATGDELTRRCAWFGVDRYTATYAIREGLFKDVDGNPFDVPIDSKFGIEGLTFRITSRIMVGDYQMQCQETGTQGNRYSGSLLPIDNITELGSAQLTALPLIPARDVESDEELRSRFYMSVRQSPYGGNIADYEKKTLAIDGVGAVKVFNSVDMGVGNVGLIIGDGQGNKATQTLINTVQNLMGVNGSGIAPIGHTVTVGTSTELTVNVAAVIQIKVGASFSVVHPVVEQTITDYINNIGFIDETVFYAKLVAAILNCHESIVDVGTVTMNGVSSNLSLTKTFANYQIPVLGIVSVTEVK